MCVPYGHNFTNGMDSDQKIWVGVSEEAILPPPTPLIPLTDPYSFFFKSLSISICKILNVRNTPNIFKWCTFQFRPCPYEGPTTLARSVFVILLWKLSSRREFLQSPFRMEFSMGSLSRHYCQSLRHYCRSLQCYSRSLRRLAVTDAAIGECRHQCRSLCGSLIILKHC